MEILSGKQHTDLYSGRFDSGAGTGKKQIQQKVWEEKKNISQRLDQRSLIKGALVLEDLKQNNCCWKQFPNFRGRPSGSYLTPKYNPCLGFLTLLLFILSWISFITEHAALLLILQLDRWPNKVESKTATLFVPVYQYPRHPPLPSSDLCHNLSANSHISALIYTTQITSGPRRTPGSPAFSYKALNAAPLKSCLLLSLFLLDVVYIQPVSSHLSVCLSLQLPVPSSFFSFLNPTLP